MGKIQLSISILGKEITQQVICIDPMKAFKAEHQQHLPQQLMIHQQGSSPLLSNLWPRNQPLNHQYLKNTFGYDQCFGMH